MSEPATALMCARADGYVALREDDPRGMIQLRADLSDPAIADALSGATGADVPEPLGSVRGDVAEILWMSPDEVLLLLPLDRVGEMLSRLGDALDGHHHLALDVSDMRAAIRLEGAAVREVLAKLTPVDMGSLPVRRVRRTRLGQIAAALWLSDERTAHVLCFRSVARYAFDVLEISARPGGEVFPV